MLITQPEVSLAAVVGIPNQQYGEEIRAFVVLKERSSLTTEALHEWSKEKPTAYIHPRHLEMMGSLPLHATGKLSRRELHSEAQAMT